MKEETKTPQIEAVKSDKLGLVLYKRLFVEGCSFGEIKTIKMHRNMSDNPALKGSANKILRLRGERGNATVAIMAGCVILYFLTGCGAVFGVKKVDLWGAKAEFFAGTDLHMGANGISRVDDNRGVGKFDDEEEDKPVIRNAGGAVYKAKE